MNLIDECKFLRDGWAYEEGHIIPDDRTCRMIHTILKLTRCKNVLEIGFNYGHSAFTFMTVDTNLVYHSLDICKYEHTLVNADHLKVRFGDRFDFTKMSSHDLDPAKASEYDMIFIDGDHETEGMSKDLNLCIQAQPKYILLDDYNSFMGGDIYPRRLLAHYFTKDDFNYQPIKEFFYPATDMTNCMLLLERKTVKRTG